MTVELVTRFVEYARANRYRLRPATIGAGAGRGLRFDPGPSNPEYASGANELPVQRALKSEATPGTVIADIGANVGFFAVISARLVGPEGHVYAFEPVAANARLVRRNASLNRLRNITVIESAVSESAGQSELILAEYSGGAALATAGPPPDATSSVMVETVTLDEMVEASRMRPPSVVKVDVEGAEMQVLRGMAQVAARFHPTVICEFDDPDRIRLADKVAEGRQWLEAAGYDVEPLDDSYDMTTWFVAHLIAKAPR